MNKPIKYYIGNRVIKYFVIIFFWVLMTFTFNTNNLPVDGEKTYGIPYKVVIIYWSRKANVMYGYYIDYYNLMLDIVFIIIVTSFYYSVRRKVTNSKL